MIVTIHQPDFIPWYGFFERWAKADIFILLDDVQFLRRGWHHRDKIKTRDGASWLTLPVVKSGRYSQLIKDVEISQATKWSHKHIETLRYAYRDAPSFDECFGKLRDVYGRKEWTKLVDLNLAFLELGREHFRINTPMVLSSSFDVQTSSTQRLVDLTRLVDGTQYLSGMGARDYLDESVFEKEDIEVSWQECEPFEYPQLHGPFVSHLSFIDMMMMGGERSSRWIKSRY